MKTHVVDSFPSLCRNPFRDHFRGQKFQNFGFFAWLIRFDGARGGVLGPHTAAPPKTNQPSNGGGSPGAHSPEKLLQFLILKVAIFILKTPWGQVHAHVHVLVHAHVHAHVH